MSRPSSCTPPLAWLTPGQPFPPVSQAWAHESAAPGLLCAGGDLTVASLTRAYSQGIFPWFSDPQPILWWSPDPRMLLAVSDFRLHPSLRKTLKKFKSAANCEIRVDSAFDSVIRNCASSARFGQQGTWITPQMIQAYQNFHLAGFAHSVETWVNGEMLGGLYFISMGEAVFGESMFHRATDCSKIAMAALIAMCQQFDVTHIDCQQNTRHLASLGAREVPRDKFTQQLRQDVCRPQPDWHFSPVYWNEILAHNPPARDL